MKNKLFQLLVLFITLCLFINIGFAEDISGVIKLDSDEVDYNSDKMSISGRILD